MKIQSIKTRIYRENEALDLFILEHISHLSEGSILVITSKIVALSEGRTADIRDKERLAKSESDWYKYSKYGLITFKDGMLMPSAGIDESNAQGRIILLPKDSYKIAKVLRKKLMKKHGLVKFGVLVTDSRSLPLRSGSVGLSVGYAGFEGVKNYKGKKDIFGRVLKVSKINIADSLASASVLLMGEGNEQCPLAIIEQAPIMFKNKVDSQELIVSPENDLYSEVFKKIRLK